MVISPVAVAVGLLLAVAAELFVVVMDFDDGLRVFADDAAVAEVAGAGAGDELAGTEGAGGTTVDDCDETDAGATEVNTWATGRAGDAGCGAETAGIIGGAGGADAASATPTATDMLVELGIAGGAVITGGAAAGSDAETAGIAGGAGGAVSASATPTATDRLVELCTVEGAGAVVDADATWSNDSAISWGLGITGTTV